MGVGREMGNSSGVWEGLQAQLLGEAGIAWATSHQHLMVQRRMQGGDSWGSQRQFPCRRQGRHGLTIATHF